MNTKPSPDAPTSNPSPAEEAIVAMRRLLSDVDARINEHLTTLSAAVFEAEGARDGWRQQCDQLIEERDAALRKAMELEMTLAVVGPPPDHRRAIACLVAATEAMERRCGRSPIANPLILNLERDDLRRLFEALEAYRAAERASGAVGVPASAPPKTEPACRLEFTDRHGGSWSHPVNTEHEGVMLAVASEAAISVKLLRPDGGLVRGFNVPAMPATPPPSPATCPCGRTVLIATVNSVMTYRPSGAIRCECGLVISRDEDAGFRWESRRRTDALRARIAELEAEAAKRNEAALLNGVARGESV